MYVTRRMMGLLVAATDRFFGASGSVANAATAVEDDAQKARHRHAASEAMHHAHRRHDRATS